MSNGSHLFLMAGDPEGNSKVFIDWILSEQGQRFVENCGYVGI
jgi:ABC-type phosphate transport system substrate-binding protein